MRLRGDGLGGGSNVPRDLRKEVEMTSEDFLGMFSFFADIFWWLRK